MHMRWYRRAETQFPRADNAVGFRCPIAVLATAPDHTTLCWVLVLSRFCPLLALDLSRFCPLFALDL